MAAPPFYNSSATAFTPSDLVWLLNHERDALFLGTVTGSADLASSPAAAAASNWVAIF